MQNQTTGVRAYRRITPFRLHLTSVIGTVFDCQLSHMEPETPCADGSHVLIRSMTFLRTKTPDTNMSVISDKCSIFQRFFGFR